MQQAREDEFARRTLGGLGWSVASQGGRQFLGLILGVILARLLSPLEFGLIAMILVFSGFAALLSEFGFTSTLVQRREICEEQLDSVFWFNLALGLLLAVGFLALAPVLADFYHEPRLVGPTRAMSAAFLLWILSTVHRAILIRSLDFRRLAIAEISGVGIGGVFAVTAAFMGYGVWSLVIQQLLQPAVSSLALWVLCRWRPKLRFSWSALRDLLDFGLNVLGYRTLSHWSHNLDSLLVGRFLGSSPLGLYSLAYRIMRFPAWNISQSLYRVMFSSFSMIQDQRGRIRELFLKLVSVVALAVFPIMFGILATAPSLVAALFGTEWLPMASVLQILCCAALFDSISGLTGILFLSQGRADLQFRVGLFLKVNTLAGITLGLAWGLNGVAIGYTAAAAVNFYPSFRFAGRLVSMPFRSIVRTVSPPLACSAAMGLAVWCVGLYLPEAWSPIQRLLVLVPIGCLIYIVAVPTFDSRTWDEIRRFYQTQIRGRIG